jgi:hypothetical protein
MVRLTSLFACVAALLSVSHASRAQAREASTLPGRAPQQRMTQHACGPWSSPKALTALPGVTALITGISRSQAGSSPVYFLSNTLKRTVDPSPLQILTINGEHIARPTGAFGFLYPNGVVTRDGKLHVVWGEPRSRLTAMPASEWMIKARVQSLWSAAYDPVARKWSRAEKLLESTGGFQWDATTAPVAVGGKVVIGTADMATPQQARDKPVGNVVVLEMAGGGWLTRRYRISEAERPSYVSASRNGDETVLAVIGPTRGNAPPPVVLASIRSDAIPKVMARTAMAPRAYGVRLLHSGHTMYAAWREDFPSGNAFAVMRRSDDGSWDSAERISLEGAIGNEAFAIDACGRLHAIFERQAGPSRIALYEATFDGKWSSPAELFAAFKPHDASIARDAAGALVLTFLGHPSAGESFAFMSKFAGR